MSKQTTGTRVLTIARAAVPLALLTVGCAASPTPRITVPPELLRPPGGGYNAEGEAPRSRYVVRMTDGDRDWEFQLPEIATAYEVKVPLRGKPRTPLAVDMAGATAADREILWQRDALERWQAKDGGAEAGDANEEPPAAETAVPVAKRGKAQPRAAASAAESGGAATVATLPAVRTTEAKSRPSYLLTLARVKELYRTRNYEMALVETVELDGQYPNDERILSMKGSVYEKLGQKQLARDAWQSALAVNPYNLAVMEALQRLGK